MIKGKGGSGRLSASEEYQRNPTLENYVALRRKHPNDKIHCMEHVRQLWAFENLPALGLDPGLYSKCLNCKAEAISDMSLTLMEKIKTVPRPVVNFLVWGMMAAIQRSNGAIPADLNRLAQYLIDGDKSSLQKSTKANDRKSMAIDYAAGQDRRSEPYSIGQIARHLGVELPTVSKWFLKEGEENYQDNGRWVSQINLETEVRKHIAGQDEFEAQARQLMDLNTDDEIKAWAEEEPRTTRKRNMAEWALMQRRSKGN